MDNRWELLVIGARAQMAVRQPETYSKFKIDFSMQYEWNLDRAEIVFKSNGQTVVSARLQMLGSICNPNGNWLWSWANESIPEGSKHRLVEVRKYGETNGFTKLTLGEWRANGDDGHDVMMVAAGILDAQAYFHDHYHNMALFFVLDSFIRMEPKS